MFFLNTNTLETLRLEQERLISNSITSMEILEKNIFVPEHKMQSFLHLFHLHISLHHPAIKILQVAKVGFISVYKSIKVHVSLNSLVSKSTKVLIRLLLSEIFFIHACFFFTSCVCTLFHYILVILCGVKQQ